MSEHQGNLFASGPTLRDHLDCAVSRAPAEMRPRLSDQCRAILARLKEGPATNRELAAYALKYSGRISDLRKAGYCVEVVSHDHKTGLVTYRLRGE